MPTAHIEAKEGEIAKLVLMPGDPLRAKYIAENYLEDYKLVNTVRNMYAYTGKYKDKEVTVFASGMGVPSMGIYAHELFKFYNVEKIIRIGTCGSFNKNIKLRDVILSLGAYSKTYFNFLLDGNDKDFVSSSNKLNEIITKKAKDLNISINLGKTITTDVFNPYCDDMEKFMSNYEKNEYLACEMEAFALFYLAEKFKKEATCLMTVVDSIYTTDTLTSADREKTLNDMILLALESI